VAGLGHDKIIFSANSISGVIMSSVVSRFLRVAAVLAIGGLVSIWAVFSLTDLVPQDIKAYVKGVASGQLSPTMDRTPGELIRHARQRLAGHPKLEFFALPVLDIAQPIFERPVPQSNFPRFGKGQQIQVEASVGVPDYLVRTTTELEDALRRATAGQVIEMAPGNYRVKGILAPRNAGEDNRRITVRAAKPGAVTIEVDTNEAFQVQQPYWIFENLHMVGICKSDEYCEHAFHIVGNAHHTIIRNNFLQDFSAHIKINGYRDAWPDDGLIEHNTLINSRPRHTSRPVTPVDLVGASRWMVADNYVANFVKADGKSTAFGIFMKGAGYGGRIERNVVVCSLADISMDGTRVGISFGGGESGRSYCRDHECVVEFEGGRAINNIVAHCNDVGIDVNRSASTFVAHNTLINTGGIDVRGEKSSALLYGNDFEGIARARKGGFLKSEMNEAGRLDKQFVAPDRLDLSWKQPPQKIPSHRRVTEDICRHPREEGTFPGALGSAGSC
jgi:hypothetical protein